MLFEPAELSLFECDLLADRDNPLLYFTTSETGFSPVVKEETSDISPFGTLRYSTSSAVRFFDYVDRFVLPEYRSNVVAAFRKAFHPPGKYEAELCVRLDDGTIRWLTHRGFTLFDSDLVTPTRIIGICDDITENVKQAREAESSQLKSLFLSQLSHELRSPLQPVTLVLSSLLDPSNPTYTLLSQTVPEVLSDLVLIQNQVDAQLRLIEGSCVSQLRC